MIASGGTRVPIRLCKLLLPQDSTPLPVQDGDAAASCAAEDAVVPLEDEVETGVLKQDDAGDGL